MVLIDGADKNLDGALAPSSPMLKPPLVIASCKLNGIIKNDVSSLINVFLDDR